jgi:uncharacterized protein involved in response to NO
MRDTASMRFVGPLFSYGFRPFFLLAALSAVLTLSTLLAGVRAGYWPPDAMLLGRWHGHEMLFGFVGAAVAGFLLTAVPTWTNSRAVSGWPLAALVLAWIAGRVVMHPAAMLQGSPLLLADALFFPLLAVAVGRALATTRNYRNLPFVAILALLTAADVAFLGAHLRWWPSLPFDPLRFVANLVQLMIALIGGRIIPLFTRNALLRSGIKITMKPSSWLDRISLAVLVGVIAVDLVRPNGVTAGVLALLGAALLAVRLARWQGWRALGMPIVWILHAGYAWLVIALALKAAWLLGEAPWAVNWLHALTAGAFGTMILGVMTRVALGHTGRPLVVSAPITGAYALVILGAALRVAGPAFASGSYSLVLSAAALCWASGFAIFLGVYLPIMVRPRADEGRIS